MPLDIMEYAPEWVKEFKRCEEWIEAALDYSHGTFTIESVFEGLMNGSLGIFPGENSVIITQLVEYPGKKVLHIFLAGGNLEELEPMYDDVEEYARSIGCQSVTLTGRPGWAKSFLRDKQFLIREIQMFKDL